MGPFRLRGGIKLTWWNAFIIGMAAMCYYIVWLCILFIELMIMVYYYMFKWMFLGIRWCYRELKSLITKSETAGH